MRRHYSSQLCSRSWTGVARPCPSLPQSPPPSLGKVWSSGPSAQLTSTGDSTRCYPNSQLQGMLRQSSLLVSSNQSLENFEHMKKTGDYYVIVVEDTNLGQIVATATLITEHKFIHSCAKRGRVEEVVVSDVCRGKQLGKLLVSTLTLLSKKLDCYKITLECAPKNVAFYTKFSYSASDETYMQCRFFD
uniref:Glucosamine 6-phosphate N-acetyltransferase n=1 Tax=Oncorhynchus tshawytscha TaxID=74940 RepID=A0A8C8FRB4_ONCTS